METRERAKLRSDLAQLIVDKDRYLSEFRAKAKELTYKIDEFEAKEEASRILEGLSEVEKQAIITELGAN